MVRCLVDGCSIRATVRITGVAKNTIQNSTRELGEACLEYQDSVFRNLKIARAQADEVWNFCYCKNKNVPDAMKGEPGIGSMWTWTGMCAQSKLIFCWQLGARDAANAHYFMSSMAERIDGRFQLTTNCNNLYPNAVEHYFGANIDYAQLVKLCGKPEDKPESRYSPGKCLGTPRTRIMGEPAPEHVSTSFVKRQNLNIRMNNRRFTPLVNAFAKKADMLAYSIAITFMYHNFVRIHQNTPQDASDEGGLPTISGQLKKWSICCRNSVTTPDRKRRQAD